MPAIRVGRAFGLELSWFQGSRPSPPRSIYNVGLNSTSQTMTPILENCKNAPAQGVEFQRPPLDATSRRGRRSLARRRGRRWGATVVETALVLNVCLMFLLALFDFGRVVMFQQLVINAAREGCRYAIVNTETATTTQVQTCVTSYLCGQQIKNLVITVYEADPTTGANLGTWTNASLANSIGVKVTGSINTITPTFSLLPSSLSLQATCIMASEGN
jgi:Flp pilus assembly protein TadG